MRTTALMRRKESPGHYRPSNPVFCERKEWGIKEAAGLVNARL